MTYPLNRHGVRQPPQVFGVYKNGQETSIWHRETLDQILAADDNRLRKQMAYLVRIHYTPAGDEWLAEQVRQRVMLLDADPLGRC